MNNNDKLFTQFPPVTTQEWENVIIKDLKGADYDKKLVWKTNENIKVQPYYREKDLENITHLNEKGAFPYAKPNGADWKIRQDYVINKDCNIPEINNLIIKCIKNGVESVGVDFNECELDLSIDMLTMLIKDIEPKIEINFMCNVDNAETIFHLLLDYSEKNKVDLNNYNFNIEFDPFAAFILKGESYLDGIDLLRNLMCESKNYPTMRIGLINASVFGNCGAYIVDELAFGLAEFADILDYLTETKLTIDYIMQKLKFQVGVGSNYFFEIAKIRTWRYLAGQMIEAYKPVNSQSVNIYIHAITSSWNKTLYDPYVNLLRTTTESMSSVIGGIDSLTVLPFNFITVKNDDFSLRLARNQQILLKEESHFDKVTDPAAGSYYIENLTRNFINNTWEQFINVIEKGGFIKCFKQNIIQDIITQSAEKRNNDIANRKENFLGVNQFPNLTETVDLDLADACLNKYNYDIDEKQCVCEHLMPSFKTLQIYRGPEAFEKLRLKTEIYSKKTGNRPKVFLFTYGNLGMRIARAGFTTNFFGCAGFEIINNNGFDTIEIGVDAAKKSKAEIVVICSSDEEYATIAPEIYNGLKDSAIVVVAGNPKESIETLKNVGLKYFIHVRTNILESLTNFQDLIIKK